jgi:uncharacterized protein YdiU (UPF0061 family)
MFNKLKRAMSAFIHEYNNPDWDYIYVLKTFRWKINRLAEDLSKSELSHDERSHLECRYIIDILDRIIKDEYSSGKHQKLILKKYSDNQSTFGTLPKKEQKQLDRELKKLLNKEEKDWNCLFNLLKKHMRFFWT